MKSRDYIILIGFIIFSLVGSVSCGHNEGERESAISDTDIMRYSRLLRLYELPGYSVAEVLSPSDTTRILNRYIMVPRDSVLPDDLPEGVLLRTPLRKMTVFSSVYTDALNEVGAIESVGGVVDAQYMTTPGILKGLKNGKVVDCGSSMSPTLEKIISSNADAIVYCQYEGMEISGIERLSIPLVTLVDNYETEPLGRAEWIRFLGELTGKGDQADRIFRRVEENYLAVKEEMSAKSNRPKVMTDNLYQGVWYVPGGASYQSRLIEDAGGDYILREDDSTGSLALSVEEMIVKAKDADVWIFRSFTPVRNREELQKIDSRYVVFSPFKTGNIYIADSSEVDIFSISAFHPDKILAEYSSIFSGEEGKYYKKLR